MAIPTMLRLGDLIIQLISVCDDIDEDDRNAILVRTLVQNPTNDYLKSPKLNIKTSGATVQNFKSLSSKIPGKNGEEASHFLPMNPGAWILSAEHQGKQGELGPFPGDYRIELEMEQISNIPDDSNNDVLSDVFENALADFGMPISPLNGVVLNNQSDPVAAAFAQGMTNEIAIPASTPTPPPVELSMPPQGPQKESAPQGPPMAGPPQGPPMAGPPQGPPMAGPPQGPPMAGPPQGPPMAGPPQGPPSGPPKGPPSGPPKGPPSGPSGPPKKAD